MALLSIPSALFNRICNLLPQYSLLHLRQVSKPMNERVCTRICTEYFEDITITLHDSYFISVLINSEYLKWELFLLYVLSQLEMTPTESIRGCIESLGGSTRDFDIDTGSAENRRRLFDYMKPLMARIEIGSLGIYTMFTTSEIQLLADFLEGKPLLIVFFAVSTSISKNNNLSAWIAFIHKFPTIYQVMMNIETLSESSTACMFQMANLVDTMEIRVEDKSSSNIIPSIKQIVNRKCESLIFRTSNCPLFPSDVDELIRYFHSLDKLIQFQGSSAVDYNSEQEIGLYYVQQSPSSVQIDHQELFYFFEDE